MRKNYNYLLSPFTTLKNVISNIIGIASYLVAERFVNLSELQKSTVSTLILHGISDNLIPALHGELLPKSKSGISLIILQGGHCNLSMKDISYNINNFQKTMQDS